MNTRTTTNEPVAEEADILAGSFVEPYTAEEAREIFDAHARRMLGISGEEFLERYDRGDYHGQKYEDTAVVSVEMMIPLVRRVVHPVRASSGSKEFTLMDTKSKPEAGSAESNGYIEGDTIDVISDEEAREIFDETARRLLGISGDEFLRRYERGDYHGQKDEDFAVVSMEMILPLIRRGR